MCRHRDMCEEAGGKFHKYHSHGASFSLSPWVKVQLNISPVPNFGVMQPIKTLSPPWFTSAGIHCAYRGKEQKCGELEELH